MQQTNRVLEKERKVDVIMDMNQSKVNTTKQVQSKAGSVAPATLTIELNVQLPVGLCGKQGHFAAKCQEKNRVWSESANKVHHTSATPGYAEGGESACDSVSDSDESIFVTERVKVVSSSMGKSSFMVPLTFHTEYSPAITTQLDTGATCSAMPRTDLLNILEIGEVELNPPGGKVRLYDRRVVEPLGSYTFIVSLNSGSECKISLRSWKMPLGPSSMATHACRLDFSRMRPVPPLLKQ